MLKTINIHVLAIYLISNKYGAPSGYPLHHPPRKRGRVVPLLSLSLYGTQVSVNEAFIHYAARGMVGAREARTKPRSGAGMSE
jgi:hypothetical protein